MNGAVKAIDRTNRELVIPEFKPATGTFYSHHQIIIRAFCRQFMQVTTGSVSSIIHCLYQLQIWTILCKITSQFSDQTIITTRKTCLRYDYVSQGRLPAHPLSLGTQIRLTSPKISKPDNLFCHEITQPLECTSLSNQAVRLPRDQNQTISTSP